MLPDVIVCKYDISIDKGGGGKDKKVSIKGALENKPRITIDREAMEMMSIIGRTCSGVAAPFGS